MSDESRSGGPWSAWLPERAPPTHFDGISPGAPPPPDEARIRQIWNEVKHRWPEPRSMVFMVADLTLDEARAKYSGPFPAKNASAGSRWAMDSRRAFYRMCGFLKDGGEECRWIESDGVKLDVKPVGPETLPPFVRIGDATDPNVWCDPEGFKRPHPYGLDAWQSYMDGEIRVYPGVMAAAVAGCPAALEHLGMKAPTADPAIAP